LRAEHGLAYKVHPSGNAAETTTAVEKGLRSAPTQLERVWREVQERLALRVSANDHRDLLRPLRPLALSAVELRIEAPSRLVAACVQDHYLAQLRDVVTEIVGARQVTLEVAQRSQGELFPEVPLQRGDREAAARRAALNLRYTFSSFVIGGSNQFAHAACRAVAGRPGNHYNPLFIYGGVGLGKTHLATAIGHAVLERHPDARIVYISAETFMNELISSLRRDRMEEFKRRYREVDMLLLDDVQLLAGRERTQEEFFHTFNALHEQRRQIVLISDKVPKEIPELEERLRSRFEWGLIADIQPPDVETRVAILQRKAELDGVALPPEVALFLAERIASNVRELEGALTRLAAHASLQHHPLTIDYARAVLQASLAGAAPAVTFEAITTVVCDHYALRQQDLLGRRRSKHVAVPRQIAMYLARHLLGASLPRLGELFGRDHTTIKHGVDATRDRVKSDVAFQLVVEQLEQRLRRDDTR
jgi:chromosomal replication initiator protein